MPGPLPPSQAAPQPPDIAQPSTVPENAPVTAATPPAANLPPGATSEPAVPLAEKIIGAGIAVAPNLMGVTQIDPWLTGWSGLINIALDKLKNERWFPEGWTPYVLIAAALLIGFGVYKILGSEQAQVALGKGAWIATTAHANWVGGKRLGIFTPTAAENRFPGVAAVMGRA